MFNEIFKNTYFEEHLRTTASELTLESDCSELCSPHKKLPFLFQIPP